MPVISVGVTGTVEDVTDSIRGIMRPVLYNYIRN